MKYFFGLFCLVLYVSALDNQSIILQITSGKTSYCAKSNEFSSFDIGEVPQLGAMCNIPPPNNEQLNFLLDINVIPILCMGVYDVFQRLCKSAKEGDFAEETPWTVEKLNDIFQSLNNIEDFSSLDKFCSKTVKKNVIVEATSKDTEFWWNEINNQFNNATSCRKVCRTYKENQVHPLCSFIVWTNEVYKKFQKSLENPKAATSGENDQNSYEKKALNLGLSNVQGNQPALLKENVLESNQITPTAAHNQLNYTVTSPNIDSGLSAFEVNDQEGNKAEIPTLKEITTHTQVSTRSPNNTQQLKVPNEHFQDNIDVVSTVKTLENKTVISKHDKTELINVDKSVVKPSVENKMHKEMEANRKNNTIIVTAVSSDIRELNDDKSVLSVSKNSGISVPQPIEGKKKMEIYSSDGTIESDFTIESTPDVLGHEPNLADKDLQQPFTDEEVEDGDGDDVDIEPEGSIKSALQHKVEPIDKTGPTKNKSSMLGFDQGAGDSDKAYGEVREVIIEDHFIEAEDSHFFTYFLFMALLTIAAYLIFHNKKKLLALALEGRRTRGSRRRPNSSNYSKLDCSLEEAMASNTTATVTHVLY